MSFILAVVCLSIYLVRHLHTSLLQETERIMYPFTKVHFVGVNVLLGPGLNPGSVRFVGLAGWATAPVLVFAIGLRTRFARDCVLTHRVNVAQVGGLISILKIR